MIVMMVMMKMMMMMMDDDDEDDDDDYDDLGSALASLSVEARNYFLNKPNLQKLFPKSTLSWETN